MTTPTKAPSASPRERRKALLAELEALRGSRVLAYVTGDRNPVPVKMDDDHVVPFHDHLRGFGPCDRIDLFLYSRGGDIEVPWRIVTALRAAARAWNVLVPFRAASGATLVALGADAIVMGRHGELGPIDPQYVLKRPDGPKEGGRPAGVAVEDVTTYLELAKESGASGDAALVELVKNTAAAAQLGAMLRVRTHIKDVARRILRSRARPPADDAVAAIIDELAAQRHAHGHAIGLAEAREIGLPVEAATEAVEAAMWSLYKEYERDLKLREPLDPLTFAGRGVDHREETTQAVVESTDALDALSGVLEIRAVRQMPPNLNVVFNPTLVGVDGKPLHAGDLSPVVAHQIQAHAHRAVAMALHEQVGITGAEVNVRGARWRRSV